MHGQTEFESLLGPRIAQYLAVRRALGRKYVTEEKELRLLDRFLLQQRIAREKEITTTVIEAFLASRPRRCPRSFNHLLGNVQRLFEWLRLQHLLQLPIVEVARRRETSRRVPFIFDAEQARRVIVAAAALPDRPKGPDRGPTYRTLFAILYGLGLRVGEACRLTCDDVDLDRGLLAVVGGKFGKSRLVPFGPRIGSLLRDHLARRAASGRFHDGPRSPLFTFDGRTTMHPGTASQTFLRIVRDIGVPVPPGIARPRLHDLRHSFAVGTLLRWYRLGIDPASRLYHLSTFLGHVDPSSTSVYLTMTAELLSEAGQRFEDYARPNTKGVAR